MEVSVSMTAKRFLTALILTAILTSPAPAPSAPAPKPAPKPENPAPLTAPKTSEPKMPTSFPKMPDVKMPPQSLNIDGVWGAYVNGQQWILQYQGGTYYGWVNGQPSEMGIYKIEGNKISGSNNNSTEFSAELELDETGKFLDMKFPNGNTIHYQRLQ